MTVVPLEPVPIFQQNLFHLLIALKIFLNRTRVLNMTLTRKIKLLSTECDVDEEDNVVGRDAGCQVVGCGVGGSASTGGSVFGAEERGRDGSTESPHKLVGFLVVVD